MLVLTYGWLLPAGVLIALLVLAALRKEWRALRLRHCCRCRWPCS
jgi:hypothetical protein